MKSRRLSSTQLILTAALVIGVSLPAASQTACGPDASRFEIQVNNAHHELAAPEPGKARVYIVQDIGGLHSPIGKGSWVTKVGMDGSWIGANKNISFFSVSVDPGLHHLCISTQSHYGDVREFRQVRVLAGETYFLRVRNLLWLTPMLIVEQVDADQGNYMITNSAMSSAQPRK